MRKYMIYLSSLLVTFILSYATITWLIMPVLTRYQSLTRLINHFDYTTLTLILLLTLIIWLFGIQYHLKHFSVIYLYLAFSVYLLLLFMVLFTKTTDFQAISLNPFDFIKIFNILVKWTYSTYWMDFSSVTFNSASLCFQFISTE